MRPTGARSILQIHPTRRCNLRCVHCYSDSGPEASDDLTPEETLRVVADAASMGYDVLSVSGGEPMSYPALAEVLAYAHSVGMRTLVTTNGMLSTRRRLERLAPHLDLLAMSLDGDRDDHDAMRAHPGAFDAMVRGLSAVRDAGVPFGFLFTLTQHNVHRLEWAAGFAVEQGASLLQIHPLEATGRGAGIAESVPDDLEAAYATLEVARLRGVWGDRLRIHLDLAGRAAVAMAIGSLPESVDPENLGHSLSPLVIEPDGWCVPLEYGFPREFALGNIRAAPLRDLAASWATVIYSQFRDVVAASMASGTGEEEPLVTYWYAAVQAAAEKSAAAHR